MRTLKGKNEFAGVEFTPATPKAVNPEVRLVGDEPLQEHKLGDEGSLTKPRRREEAEDPTAAWEGGLKQRRSRGLSGGRG